MKIEEAETGSIRIDCMSCGTLFKVDDFRTGECADIIAELYEQSRLCPMCEDKQKAEQRRLEEERRKADYLAHLPDLIREAGLPDMYIRDRATGAPFIAPPVRFVAEWIWKHRGHNLLLSGITGSGKSTSACFVASKMVIEGRRVRYTSLRKLLADWREAKKTDHPYAAEKLLAGIFRQDIFIIDEVAGKARVTDSGQELLFELLESVNNGECRARLWLLGNFYTGSIEDLFSDPDPVRRRLQENFDCLLIDRHEGTITSLQVWEER